MSISQEVQREVCKLKSIELNLRENIRRILVENNELKEENNLLKAKLKYIKQLYYCQQGIISNQLKEKQENDNKLLSSYPNELSGTGENNE